MEGITGQRLGDRDVELEMGGERADGGPGRRGEVSRRRFIRMGVLGTAMASVGLLDRDRQAAADLLGSNLRYAVPNGATGLTQAGPELALPPGFSYVTFGRYGSAMSDGFSPYEPPSAVNRSRVPTMRSSASTTWLRSVVSVVTPSNGNG